MSRARPRGHRGGRPPLCTPEITGAISELVRAGTYPQIAAQANGISRTTYFNWMARGRRARERSDEGFPTPASDRDYVEFLDSIEQAEAQAEGIATTHLMKALPNAPSANLAFLERRFGKRWSPRGPLDEEPASSTPASLERPSPPRGWSSGAPAGISWRQAAGLPEEGGLDPTHSQSRPATASRVDANAREIPVPPIRGSTNRRGAPVRRPAGKSANGAPTPIRPRVGRRVALHTPPSPAT